MAELLEIESARGNRTYWADLWKYRELLFFLAWRDILIRYKQAVLGVGWAVIRPLLTMVILTEVFGRVAHLSSRGEPYPLLVFCAMIPWQFFSTVLGDTGASLVTNAQMVTKVYFPRLIIPASAVLVAFVDMLVSLVLLVIMMIWYHVVPTWRFLALPAFSLLVFGLAFGAGAMLSALMVRYRDVRFIVPFIVQLGLYVSPVGFMSDLVSAKWRTLYALNPMVAVIDGFRWSIMGAAMPISVTSTVIGVLVAALIIVTGISYFRREEDVMADRI